jgi:hypothetical protein
VIQSISRGGYLEKFTKAPFVQVSETLRVEKQLDVYGAVCWREMSRPTKARAPASVTEGLWVDMPSQVPASLRRNVDVDRVSFRLDLDGRFVVAELSILGRLQLLTTDLHVILADQCLESVRAVFVDRDLADSRVRPPDVRAVKDNRAALDGIAADSDGALDSEPFQGCRNGRGAGVGIAADARDPQYQPHPTSVLPNLRHELARQGPQLRIRSVEPYPRARPRRPLDRGCPTWHSRPGA